MNVKNELAKKAGNTGQVKLTKNMTTADMIKVLEPEIARALPSVITPERFTRMALNALNNTPLGQAYLIPYKNKGVLEYQFQIGYKGLLDFVYRNDMVQTVQAQVVYEHDEFRYSLGLNSELVHVPALSDRGKAVAFYALFKLENGGYGFEVMSKPNMDVFAKKHSKGISSAYSPWNTNYEDMAKKTVIKRVLKYAPLKSDFQRALSNDGTIKTEFAMDMSEVAPEDIIDAEEGEVVETSNE